MTTTPTRIRNSRPEVLPGEQAPRMLRALAPVPNGVIVWRPIHTLVREDADR